MLDLMMLVLGLGFFVLALGFVAACDEIGRASCRERV